MATWEELKQKADKELQEDLILYTNAVKYAKHSKRKAKAQKILEGLIYSDQHRKDIKTLSLEELGDKYPELYSQEALEERITYLG